MVNLGCCASPDPTMEIDGCGLRCGSQAGEFAGSGEVFDLGEKPVERCFTFGDGFISHDGCYDWWCHPYDVPGRF